MKYSTLILAILLLFFGCQSVMDLIGGPDNAIAAAETAGGAVATGFGLPAKIGAVAAASLLGLFGIRKTVQKLKASR